MPLPNAFTALGMIGNQGYLVSADLSTGQCEYEPVGGLGGLTGYTFITGTSAPDWITMISSQSSWCNYTMTPLITNGYTVQINAGSGSDVIDAQAFSSMLLGGDGGDDYVNHPAFGGWLFGYDGNDEIRSNGYSAFWGEANNDKLCAGPSVVVARFDGGTGIDYHCGIPDVLISSTLNCGQCGF